MDPAEELRKMGFSVRQFNECHFRVDNEIDYWLPRGKWYDRVMKDRGQKPLDQLPYFIKRRLDLRPVALNKEQFINLLISQGWDRGKACEAWEARSYLAQQNV